MTSRAPEARSDPHRPRCHVTAPSGWLNDANGLAHRDGRYHLFYQHNPYAAVHDRIHWGHVSGTDLVHWVDEPVALSPGETGPDRDGCWSGVLVDDGGVPTLVYSGRHGGRELPCLAVGSPDLRTWTKDPANPVVPSTPPGIDVTAYRDHCVWREDGRWRMLVGAGVRGAGGTAFLYGSDDLRSWELVGPLLVGSATDPGPGHPLWTGTAWECVEVFRLCEDGSSGPVGDPVLGAAPGVDVLVLSVWDEGVTHHPLYATGRYADDRFEVAAWHRLDIGGRYFYAPQSMTDATGRRVVFGWLQEGRGAAASVAAGWSGAMSLPRVATLAPGGTIALAPAAEVALLRGEATSVDVGALAPGDEVRLPVRGARLDVEVVVTLPVGGALRLLLRVSPDGSERTVVELSRTGPRTALLRLDRSCSSVDPDPDLDTDELSGDVPLSAGPVLLRVLLDASALEVFAGGRALTARTYPVSTDAHGVALQADGADVRVDRLTTWPLGEAFGRR